MDKGMIATGCLAIPGAVFLFVGIIKSLNSKPFIHHIHRFRLFPKPLASLIAILLIQLECGIGLALILNLYPLQLIPIAIGALLLFALFTIWGIKTQRIVDCGCYGGLIAVSPTASLSLNLCYALLLGIALHFSNETVINDIRMVWPVLGVIILSNMLSKRSIQRPLLDLSPLKIGKHWKRTWAPEMAEKEEEQLIFLLNLNCSQCREWLNLLEKASYDDFVVKPICVIPEKSRFPDLFQSEEARKKIPLYQIPTWKFNFLVPQPPVAIRLRAGKIDRIWREDFPIEWLEKELPA